MHDTRISGGWSRHLLLSALAVVVAFGMLGCKKKAGTDSFSVSEAEHNVQKIFDGAKVYYERGDTADRSGTVVPAQFPATMPLYPATKCCKQKNKLCQPVEGKDGFLSQPSLAAVGFEIADPHAFQYRLVSSGTKTDSKLTVQAVADPKCDGKHVVVELKATVDKDHNVQRGKITIRRGVTTLD